jgi:hypothetical protein
MARTIYVDCPQCGSEVLVDVQYEGPDNDVNIVGGWFYDSYTQTCACALTGEQENAVIDCATDHANNEPYETEI